MKRLTLLTACLLFVNLISAQWVQQNPNYPDTNAALNSIFFIDEYNGWTGGSDDEWGVPSFYSNDGGNTWGGMLILMWDAVNDIYFSDINNGWAVGDNGQISHTNDGGSYMWSWEMQESNTQYDLVSVFFLDSLNGWAIGNGYYGMLSDLIYTTDGGKVWTSLNGSFFNGEFITDIYFIDENAGWVVGEYFQYSTDGGMTWEGQLFGTYSTQGMAFSVVDENNMWIAGYSYESYPYYGVIYNSNDGGNTWESLLGDTIPPLNDIAFVNEYMGWAVGNEGSILHTFDGGLSWEYQESGTQADLFSISFADENHGWICGDSSIILHTNNGGITGIQTLDSKRLTAVEIYPNPISNNCTIEFCLKQQSYVTIQIFNNMGETICELENKTFQSGSNKVCWNAGDLKKGIYLCKIQIGKETISKKLIKAN